MKKHASALAALLVTAAMAAPGAAQADEMIGSEVPWVDAVRSTLSNTDVSVMSRAQAQPAAAGSSGMQLVGNSDKDGTTNSDLAFWGDLAYAGNYSGFRILDVKRDQPRVLVDFPCNGAQSDPTVWDTGKRRLLFQSVDSQQTTDDCSSTNTSTVNGVRQPGFEGIRIFDVTNPGAPRFIDGVQTDCGSHTNTLIPDAKNKRVAIYVSSYPLGSGIGPDCQPPHKKISILDVPYDVESESDVTVKEQPLSTDTTPSSLGGFQGCHDVVAILPTDTAVGACAGDGQVWDISDPLNPTTTDADEGEHTHIRSPGGGDTFEFIHTSIVTPDLQRFVLTDETGGGGAPTCNGAATTDGFYYYYDMVNPGEAPPTLRSRYTIPRAQTPEICVSHNGNFIPVKNRNLMTAANYQGGTTVVDWDASGGPREVAFADLEDQTGLEDAWSSYYYRDRIFVNGGLNRRGATGNRGLDVYRLTDRRLDRGAAKLRRLNPQTVEQRVGRGDHREDDRDDDRDDHGDDD